jgi:small subunit ribosomal protein S20
VGSPPRPGIHFNDQFYGTEMANTKSAKKAARQTLRRTAVNQARRSSMRTAVRNVDAALAAGDKDAALAALKSAEPAMMRAARHGIMHKKKASRKVSRLAQRVAKLGK